MTPIDWKLSRVGDNVKVLEIHGHHSLMTPIDWKLQVWIIEPVLALPEVTTR